jgi:arsenate reductase-like glutaredoxin family protein
VEVQIFGTNKSADTKKALRFFSERRIKTHFVDFNDRPPSKRELQRFAQKFRITALIDKSARRYADLGLGAVRYDDGRWLEKLSEEPFIIRQPLVRWQHKVTIGLADAEWKAWVEASKP